MATTAGALTLVSVADTSAQLSSAVATGGTGPYTYQWYRSTTSGFSPAGGNLISGATALTLSDTGLIPNTQYYYKVVATDSGAVTGTSAQLSVATIQPQLSQNQFIQTPFLGMLDQKFNYDTISAQVDVSQATALVPGQAVKMVDSADGIPKVIACAANADEVLGFIVFDIKSRVYAAGDRCELSLSGNVMYLYATGAIARGVQVQLDITTKGGVAAAVGSSGADIVGWAFDKAAAGALFRVHVKTPSFAKA